MAEDLRDNAGGWPCPASPGEKAHNQAVSAWLWALEFCDSKQRDTIAGEFPHIPRPLGFRLDSEQMDQHLAHLFQRVCRRGGGF